MTTRLPLILFAAVALVVPTVAAQTIAVLQVTAETPTTDGRVTLTLASGTTITIPATDIDQQLTDTVKSTLEREAAIADVKASATPPSSSAAQPIIRAKCLREWADDFQMRAFCEKQQNGALEVLRSRTMTSTDQQSIRARCAREWVDDFQMQSFCEEQQLEALKSLR